MASTTVLKIKDPDKKGDFLILDASEFDPEKHKLYSQEEEEAPAPAESSGPALISPATVVADNQVVIPRTPHPEGLIPPAADGKPVPPKAEIGPVIGVNAGQEVRSDIPENRSPEIDVENADRPMLFAFLRENGVEVGNASSTDTLREQAREVLESREEQK